MDSLWRSPGGKRGSRQGHATIVLVEPLERRSLLSVQVGPITTVAGQTFNGQVATFAAGDVQGTLAGFQATINWGGGLSPTTSGTIGQDSLGGYVVYGSNIYPQPGQYNVTVLVTGANNSSASGSGTATVQDAMLTTTAVTVNPTLSDSFTGVVASFQSANPYATTGDFTASINWGDADSNAPGIISANGSGGFNVVGQKPSPYQEAKSFPILVTIISPGGQVNVVNSQADVTALPVSVFPVNVTGGVNQQLPPVTVATFVDPNVMDTTNDFQASIDWGDGTTSNGTIGGGTNGVYTVTGTKPSPYSTAGTYPVNIQIVRTSNSQTATASGQAVITTLVQTIVATGTTFPATPGVLLPSTTVLANFTDPNPADITSPSLIKAVINWGDGQSSIGMVNLVSVSGAIGTFSVTEPPTDTHVYSTFGAAGSYAVTVTIVDPSGQSAMANSTALIVLAVPITSPIGGLSDAISNGPHAAMGFTNTDRPTFSGTAAPFSIVQLYARHFNADAELPVGEAVTNASGQWTSTTGPLAVGTWIFTATVTISGGYPSNMIPLTNADGTELVYIDLSPRLVRWLSHGQKSVPHPKMSKPPGARHHKA
jgi:hypothetical protein